MLLNNAVGYGQAQSRTSRLAFTRRGLGSEEWIVNPMNMLLRNSGSSIRNHHAHAVAIRGRNAQRSAMAHRVLRIQEQVQKHLLQPPRFPVDQRRSAAAFILHFDPRDLELVLQQRQRIGDNLVDINRRKLSAAGAGKIQQVVNDLRGAESLPRDLFQKRALCGSP